MIAWDADWLGVPVLPRLVQCEAGRPPEPAVINVAADTGGRALNIQNIEVCQTNPTTGACTTTRAASTSLTLNNNTTATFGIFVRGTGSAIDNDPARNRVFVRFTDVGGERGATSVAVRTQ